MFWPHRLAWSRTDGSQPLNTGSNPVGATLILALAVCFIIKSLNELRIKKQDFPCIQNLFMLQEIKKEG